MVQEQLQVLIDEQRKLREQLGAIWRAQGDVGQAPLCSAASGRSVPPKEPLIAVVPWRLMWQSYDEGDWKWLGPAFMVLRMFEHGALLSPMSRHSVDMSYNFPGNNSERTCPATAR